MLELSMATMYKNAMSKAVEANFEKSIRNYYAQSINMAKLLDKIVDQCDHYRKEGLRQNELVKDLLEQNTQLKRHREEIDSSRVRARNIRRVVKRKRHCQGVCRIDRWWWCCIRWCCIQLML